MMMMVRFFANQNKNLLLFLVFCFILEKCRLLGVISSFSIDFTRVNDAVSVCPVAYFTVNI